MSDSIKAIRKLVSIGSLTVDGFMLPDGSYQMSQVQVSEAVGLKRGNVSDFLRSKALKGLLGEDFTCPILEQGAIEIESSEGSRGQSRFLPIPLRVVSAYWHWQSHRGNKTALALCMALTTESLERRFDDAFGIKHTEQERNDRLAQWVQQLEVMLGEAYAIGDDDHSQLAYINRWLQERGLNPWETRGTEQDDD